MPPVRSAVARYLHSKPSEFGRRSTLEDCSRKDKRIVEEGEIGKERQIPI